MRSALEFGLGQVAVDDEQHQVGTAGHLFGQLLACLAVDLIDAGRVDQEDVAVAELVPLTALDGRVSPCSGLVAKRCSPSSALTSADFPTLTRAEDGDMDVSVFELVQHALDLSVVLGE